MEPDNSSSILHRIELETTKKKAFLAVLEPEGLRAWWTPRVSGTATVGGVVSFRFGDGDHGPDMQIEAVEPDERVVWKCIAGPWEGMRFVFEVKPHERGSVLYFRHEGWTKQGDFFMHCNAKWGFFLAVSLKNYLETGRGKPNPQDPGI